MQYPERLDRYRKQVEPVLERSAAAFNGPAALREAMSYSLTAGGKRLRPTLVLATRDLFGADGHDPWPAACALEFVHTYSLIHDDLPALDNDDLRRGMPTCHKRFGEALALLAGDALLTEAFHLIARSYRYAAPAVGIALVAELSEAAGAAGMVGGQVLDTVNVDPNASMTAVEQVHRMKTGALIIASVRCGAILGSADEASLGALTRYAAHIGLAFQVTDDILDVTSTAQELGKTIGKDAAQHKTTYVSAWGVEKSRAYAAELIERAVAELSVFGDRAATLRDLAHFIRERKN